MIDFFKNEKKHFPLRNLIVGGLSTLAATTFSMSTQAQNYNATWGNLVGTSLDASAAITCMTNDASGNMYIVDGYAGTVLLQMQEGKLVRKFTIVR